MSFGAGDYAWLLMAFVMLFVPGALVLVAAGWLSRGRTTVGIAIAPLVSIAVCYVTAVLTGLLGWRYGLVAVGVTTVVIAAIALALRFVRRGSIRREAVRTRSGRSIPVWWWGEVTGGVVLVAIACVISVRTWARGMGGSLATVPQEHDMITHTLLTAHIAKSGQAAPWKVLPEDLLSGTPSGFYPSGFHSVAALVADAGTDAVTAVNATMLIVLALCLPLGLLALATQLQHVPRPYLVGGVAAVVGAMAYRPTYAMFHDGGILANDMAISLAPAALAGILVLRERASAPATAPVVAERGWWLDVALIGAVAVAAFAVHPSSAAIIGISAAAWFVGELVHRTQRKLFWRRLLKLSAGAVAAAVLAIPLLRGGGSSVSTVAAWPRDLAAQPFPDAVGITLGMPYRGFVDVTNQHSQALFAIVVLVGVVAVLVTRRGLALGAVWVAWSGLLIAFLVDWTGPGVATATGIFYNSYIRISGVLGAFQWLMVGIAVTTVAALVVRVAERLTSTLRRRSAHRWAPVTAVVVALVLGLVLVLATTGYRATNGSALASRYAQPVFTRVDGNDRAAFAWLDKHVRPGERVMNNANDGSTYLYVYDGIPVVNTATLGSAAAPYFDELLANFNQLDTNRQVQQAVRDLNIRWVYFDAQAPAIGVVPAFYPWYTGDSPYTIAPGMMGLDTVADLTHRFTSGSVSVYEVAPSLLRPGA